MKKGFTLIELLAVIVVLALIALIAIPQITKVTNKAKESANKRSLEGHIENMNLQMAMNISNNDYADKTYTFDEFNFANYKAKDNIRCESYKVVNGAVVEATNCIINKKVYCYNKNGASTCGDDSNLVTGTTGDLTWYINLSNNTLTIDGKGKMADYTESSLAPWYKYKEYIKHIVVGEDVTKLGNYAFYELVDVETLRINSKSLQDFPRQADNPNIGTNYALHHIGQNVGTTVIFGPNVTRVPNMLMNPSGYGHDKTNVINFIFEGNKISFVGAYGFAYYKGNILVVPEGVNGHAGLSFGYGKTKLLIFPDSLVGFGDWSITGNEKLNKIVFGPNTNVIPKNSISNSPKLTTIVLPHINNTASNGLSLQKDKTITIYGDATTEEWVNNLKAESGQTNLVYKNINEYKSSITSNTNITGSVGYNGTFTFESSGNVKVYYKYVDSTGNEALSNPISVLKNGTSYTIEKIKSDIYIEVK